MEEVGLRTAVFVDYEYWYISQDIEFRTLPNIGLWIDDLKKRGQINELTFFGDFTNNNLFNEIKQIRTYTNRIIDTRQTGHFKKDYTDFIMLDHIYQKTISDPQLEQVVLFTGDAHFSSVASYLHLNCNKVVGLYGITGTVSQQLTGIANWFVEYPFPDGYLEKYIYLVIDNFQKTASDPKFYPSFKGTASHISVSQRVDYEMVVEALSFMLAKGYLYRDDVLDETSGEIRFKFLRANWNLLKSVGLIE